MAIEKMLRANRPRSRSRLRGKSEEIKAGVKAQSKRLKAKEKTRAAVERKNQIDEIDQMNEKNQINEINETNQTNQIDQINQITEIDQSRFQNCTWSCSTSNLSSSIC